MNADYIKGLWSCSVEESEFFGVSGDFAKPSDFAGFAGIGTLLWWRSWLFADLGLLDAAVWIGDSLSRFCHRKAFSSSRIGAIGRVVEPEISRICKKDWFQRDADGEVLALPWYPDLVSHLRRDWELAVFD